MRFLAFLKVTSYPKVTGTQKSNWRPYILIMDNVEKHCILMEERLFWVFETHKVNYLVTILFRNMRETGHISKVLILLSVRRLWQYEISARNSSLRQLNC